MIENWSWHGPTKDSGTLVLDKKQTVEIVVEHFQIDGYAVLDFSLAPEGQATKVQPETSEASPPIRIDGP